MDTFSALRSRDFRLLWIGAFLSTTGTWMQTVAQGWVVYSITGSAFLLAFDGFLGAFPMILFSLVGGVIADRMERRKILLVSQVAQMIFAFILAGLIFAGEIQVWHIFILSFLTGTAQAFSGPAYISLLPLLVKRDDVPNAIAMNSMQFNLARVIGPFIAGIALTTLGAAVCFGLNGLSFLAVIVALLAIRSPFPRSGGERKPILHEMAEGFGFVGRHRALLQLTFLAFVSTLFGVPLITFLPVVAERILSLDARGYSWLMTAYGAGAVAGALLLASSGKVERKGLRGLQMQFAFAIFLAMFAFSRTLWLTLAMSFFAGVCLTGVIALYNSLVQLETSDEMRGRVMSIFMLSFRGGMPLGNLIAGAVAERFSVPVALGANAAIVAAIAIAFLASPAAVKRV